ncbi:ATP-binding cassette domain-containing protein, partial [Clostridium sp.]|uniref:ATP-binding cassette domain-containing protein n=1 Tax=Clostridium sp. TaxID=1506 RepID=UPI003F7FE3CD
MLSSEFFIPLRLLGSFFHIAMNGMAASKKIFKILDLDEGEEKTEVIDENNLAISFKNVGFAYDEERSILNGVDLDISEKGFVSIVGESGCGKSVTSRAIMRLVEAPQGEIKKCSKILFNGENILNYDKKKIREFRGGDCAMIFQDALTSLNPTMKIGKQIMENLIIHRHMDKKAAKEEAIKILKLVGIPNA